jgi:hypothetical protein
MCHSEDVYASVLSRVTLDNPLAPLGERVASVASRVRGSAESMIVKNYAGHHTRRSGFLLHLLCEMQVSVNRP